ncbi:MAG: hypothetical protein M3N29_10755 [Chloroflexota bacterium]|nr:hypothetical protein [Chloroflexota bacterium]
MPEPEVAAAAAAIARRKGRRRRRALRVVGTLLIAYGVLGLVLLGVVGSPLSEPIDDFTALSDSVEEQRTAALDALDEAAETVDGAAAAVRNTDASLTQARAAVDRSSALSRGVAASMYQLAEAMTLTIFGMQPLIGLSTGFQQTGDQLVLLGDDLTAIGEALAANREDALGVAHSLDQLAAAIEQLSDEVRNGPRVEIAAESVEAVRLGVLAVLGWLALLALAAIVAGAFCWWLARGELAAT